MNYTDNVLLTEVSESFPIFTTNKTLHERFTQKQNRYVFIRNNGYTEHFRNNWLRNRVVIRSRKSLKIRIGFSRCGSRKGNKATDVDSISNYTSEEDLCPVSGNRRVVMFPCEFEEDCSSIKNDINMKNSDGNDGSEELHDMRDNTHVILMSDGFKEDCFTVENDIDMDTGGNDCSNELSAISDSRNALLMPSESKQDCCMVKNEIDMRNVGGSDGGNKEEPSVISNNRRVILMPTGCEEGCSVAKKDIDSKDNGGNTNSSSENCNERSQRAINKASFNNYFGNGYLDCSSRSEPIIFKRNMLKRKNRGSSSRRSTTRQSSIKRISLSYRHSNGNEKGRRGKTWIEK